MLPHSGLKYCSEEKKKSFVLKNDKNAALFGIKQMISA